MTETGISDSWSSLEPTERREQALQAVRAGNIDALWILIDAYLEHQGREHRLAPHTVRGYRHAIETLLHSWTGDEMLRADSEQAKRLIESLLDAGLEPSSIRVHVAAFRLLYRALRWVGATESMPFHLVRVERAGGETGREKYTYSECGQLLSVADRVDQALILLIAQAGLSVSESVSLQWDCVDLEKSRLLIPPGYQRATRTVDISPRLAEALRALPRRSHRVLSFATDARARQRMQQLCRRAGITYRGVHALRGAGENLRPEVPAISLGTSHELSKAMAEHQLELYYVPVMQLRTGKIEGVETLVRWDDPRRHLLLPDALPPGTEQAGLVKELNGWILDAALRQWHAWNTDGLTLRLWINLSTQALHNPHFPGTIERAITTWEADPYHLVVQVSDSIISGHPHRAVRVLSQLQEMGIGTSIDHYGAGQVSLPLLSRLPFDEIKIARPLIGDMASHPDHSEVVKSIIDLGHQLDLEVGALGVEDQATLEALTRLGCDTAQGHYICAPLPAGQVEDWLRGPGPRLSLDTPSTRRA